MDSRQECQPVCLPMLRWGSQPPPRTEEPKAPASGHTAAAELAGAGQPHTA